MTFLGIRATCAQCSEGDGAWVHCSAMNMLVDPFERIRTRLHDYVAWAAPDDCVGCGVADRALCRECRSTLRPDPRIICRPDFHLMAWAAFPFTPLTRDVIVALKERGTRSFASSLSPAIAALSAVNQVAQDADLILIPPSRPSAYRSRGFHPAELIVNAAGLRVTHAFTVDASERDQRGLSAAERRANLSRPLTIRTGFARELSGAKVLLIDDVLTTGATFARLRDSALAAGCRIVGMWALTAVEWDVQRTPV